MVINQVLLSKYCIFSLHCRFKTNKIWLNINFIFEKLFAYKWMKSYFTAHLQESTSGSYPVKDRSRAETMIIFMID